MKTKYLVLMDGNHTVVEKWNEIPPIFNTINPFDSYEKVFTNWHYPVEGGPGKMHTFFPAEAYYQKVNIIRWNCVGKNAAKDVGFYRKADFVETAEDKTFLEPTVFEYMHARCPKDR